jgi:hypothetical protein
MKLTLHLYTVTLFKVAVMVFGGVVLGKVIEEKRWTRFFRVFTRPILKTAHLPIYCEGALITALISGYAGDALLSFHYREGKLSAQQAILSSMILNFPLFLSFIPLIIGIVYPLMGWAGLIYIGCQILASFGLMLTAMATGRLKFPPETWEDDKNNDQGPLPPIYKVLKRALRESFYITFRIILITAPVMGLVFYLVNVGFFQDLQRALASHLLFPGLSPSALTVSAAHAVHIAGGAAVAGALLQGGIITTKEAVLSMLLGNAVGTPFRSLRLNFPRYAALYPTRLALSIILTTQGVRVVMVLLIYFLIFLLW